MPMDVFDEFGGEFMKKAKNLMTADPMTVAPDAPLVEEEITA